MLPDPLLSRNRTTPWRGWLFGLVILLACGAWASARSASTPIARASPSPTLPTATSPATRPTEAATRETVRPTAVTPKGTHPPASSPAPPSTFPAGSSQPAKSSTATASAPASQYDPWLLFRAIAPALVAIVLAISTRQVLPSLSLGILMAAAMMIGPQWSWSLNPLNWCSFLIACVTHGVDDYLFGVLAPLKKGGSGVDLDHLKILVFTFLIGAMIGIVEANGGTRAMVARVTRRVRSRRMGQFWAGVAGVIVFFDDYANAMIIGPSMRPIFDRLRISRQKLAYIVDATAAPVASLFIGTWLAAEIGFLKTGFDAMGGDVPAFMTGIDATQAFWASIPYRTYAILAIVMVFIIALTGRDFGSMKKAEADAAAGHGHGIKPGNTTDETMNHNTGEGWWLGAVPVAVLVGMTVGLLFYTGYGKCQQAGTILTWEFGHLWANIKTVLGQADSYPALVYGSLTAAVTAAVTSVFSRKLTLTKTMDGAVAGMSRMFAACIVLVLAWGLSKGGEDLQLGLQAKGFLLAQIESGNFPVTLLPLAIFITACVISFATGTSYGTMGILCPAVIPIAAGVYAGLPPDQALPLFYAAVGAVLAGAVFGDHCSPISDTTVLSAIATECELSAHAWTQMPYAIVVAVVGCLSTDGLRYAIPKWAPQFAETYRHWSWAYGLTIGAVILLLFTLLVGRRPKTPAVQPEIIIQR